VIEGYFVGYASPKKRIFVPCEGRIIEWLNVDFQKYTLPLKGKGAAWMFDYDSLFGSFNPTTETNEDDLTATFYQQQSDDSRPVGVSTSTDETTLTSDTSTPSNSHGHVLADLEDESSSEDEDAIEIVPGTQSPMQYDVVASSSQTLDSAGASSSSLDPAEQNLNNLDSEVNVLQHTTSRIHNYHPHENIIGNPSSGV